MDFKNKKIFLFIKGNAEYSVVLHFLIKKLERTNENFESES